MDHFFYLEIFFKVSLYLFVWLQHLLQFRLLRKLWHNDNDNDKDWQHCSNFSRYCHNGSTIPPIGDHSVCRFTLDVRRFGLALLWRVLSGRSARCRPEPSRRRFRMSADPCQPSWRCYGLRSEALWAQRLWPGCARTFCSVLRTD